MVGEEKALSVHKPKPAAGRKPAVRKKRRRFRVGAARLMAAERARRLLLADARTKKLIEAEQAHILARVTPWSGSDEESLAWYNSQKIAALGNVTAKKLVAEGLGHRVRAYLDAIEVGAFA